MSSEPRENLLGASGVALIGRYEVHAQIAAGGMARVHLGRLRGAAGFGRTVAIKRLHPWLVADPSFAHMLIDEARLAARIRHPNVVATLDVIAEGDELLIVMDYVLGESLSRLIRLAAGAGRPIPRPIALALVVGALHGVHAAHEATAEDGTPLEIIHRDLSPHNVLVDVHGLARVVDFGIAKALGRMQETQPSQLKGKVRYMAPEQVHGSTSRRSDLFSMGVVLWQLLTGRRLFDGDNDGEVLARVLACNIPRPTSFDPTISSELERVVLQSLARAPESRHATALAMARAIETADVTARASEVAEWLEQIGGDELTAKRRLLAEVERTGSTERVWSTTAPSDPRLVDVPGDGTKLTSSSATPRRPAGNRRFATLIVLLALAGSATALASWQWRARAAALGPEAEPGATAASPPPPTASAAAPHATGSELVPADAAAAIDAKPAAPRRKPSSARPSKRPAASCNPPYKVDPATGHTVFKRECL
jgi:eukaryotic-like serine/threonine-protein kinase